MSIDGVNIGVGISGSFCTLEKVKEEIRNMVKEGANVIPVVSFHAQSMDTRFGKARDYLQELEFITGKQPVLTIEGAEPLGPKGLMDIYLLAPCTGNTLAKLCTGITDTPVLMAAKGHMRNERPVVISVSTNDALGINLKNIGALMSTKGMFFVPFGQDSYLGKPKSMVAHVELIIPTIEAAMERKQLQPVVRSPFS